MQRATSASSLQKDPSQFPPDDPAVGRVEPERSPVLEVPVGSSERQGQLPVPSSAGPRGKGSYTSLSIPDDSARKYKPGRRRADWACEVQRIAMIVVVFSLMAWVTYLFLTKDE